MKPGRNSDPSFEIRTETLSANVSDEFSILYLSDLHFTKRSGAMVAEIVAVINELQPTILLFGGDYTDTKQGLIHLKTLLGAVQNIQYLFAIAGNHDIWFGLDKFEEMFENANVKRLGKINAKIIINKTSISIDNRPEQKTEAPNNFSILCLHEPVDVAPFNYNLIVAGHLHGCQVVLWENDKGLFPGRFFYKWNRLKVQLKNGLYLISKGLGDTIPIRYNCTKDLLFVRIIPNNQQSLS